ncbi:MAG: T9SS type A sorting domain-containing protein, partial [Saprospiraceae bacterium]|nr:T9SS type A sorting domain-containing protein [Saprospiraceae bacterium]
IKQVDFDGKYSYSHVEIIRVDDKNDVRIAPTITDNTLEIQANSLDYDIEIIDAGGQVNAALFGLKGDETLDVSSLASGIYILSYKTSEIRKLTKFVKL